MGELNCKVTYASLRESVRGDPDAEQERPVT
jgi:hypothetical protein